MLSPLGKEQICIEEQIAHIQKQRAFILKFDTYLHLSFLTEILTSLKSSYLSPAAGHSVVGRLIVAAAH